MVCAVKQDAYFDMISCYGHEFLDLSNLFVNLVVVVVVVRDLGFDEEK